MKTLIFRIVCFLWAIFFMPFLAFSAKVVDVNFSQYTNADNKGNLTSPAASMVSDRYGVVNGVLTKFGGDGQNLADDTEDLTTATWTHTATTDSSTLVTFTAQNDYIHQPIATTEGNYYLFSFKCRNITGNASIQIYHLASESGDTTLITNSSVYYWDGSAWQSDTSAGLTSTLTRYYVIISGRVGGGNINFGVRDNNASGHGQIEFTEIQVEDLGTLTTSPGPELFDQETLGSESVSNADFESGFTGGLADGWSNVYTQTVSEETSNVHGGSSAQKITVSDDGANSGIQQSVSRTAGVIYKLSGWVYCSNANSVRMFWQAEVLEQKPADSAWTYFEAYVIGSSTGSSNFNISQTSGNCTTADYLIIDDVSIKAVTAPNKGIPDVDPWPALAGSVTYSNDCSSDTFTESVGVGWTYDAVNDEYDCDGSQVAQSNLGYDVNSDDTFYWYSFEIKNYVAGNVRINIGGAGGTSIGDWKSGDGTHTGFIYSNGTALWMQADADFNGSVDTVILRPVQISWVPYGTNTIAIDETEDALLVTYVDTDTGATLAFANAADLFSDLIVGNSYTVQFDAKVGSGDTVDVEIAQSDNTELASTDNIAESWTTYTLGFTCTNVATDKIQFDDMGAGDVIYIRNLSIKENTLRSAEPRTYVADNGTIPADWPITDYGLQFDGQGTNLCPYSEDFSQWTASNITATQNIDGVDGVSDSAYTLTATDANGTLLIDLAPLASTDYYFSIWMKRVTGTGNIDLTDNNGSNWTTQTLTSEWQRFSITRSQADPHVGIRIVTNGDAIAVFGAQVEATPYMTSYIPTDGSPVTRTTMAQDASDNGLQWTIGTVLNSVLTGAGAEGTLIMDGFVPMFNEANHNGSGNDGILSCSDAAQSFLYLDDGIFASYDGTGSSTVDPNIALATDHLLAISWDVGNDLDIGALPSGGSWSWDATPATVDAAAFVVGGDAEFKIGYGNDFPFYIDRIRIYDKKYTQDQMESGTYEGLTPKWGGSPWGRSGWGDSGWNL